MQPDKDAIAHAIVNWAYGRMAGSPAPLYLILADHGDRGRFILDDDGSVITPEELNGWLGELENLLPSEVLEEEPRVVIVSACFSGSFIHADGRTSLSKPGRIVISSAAENEVSYKGPREADGIRGGSYFTDTLFEYLGRGETLRNAFALSTADTELFTPAFDWLPVEDPDGVRYVLILINRAENFITYLAEDLTQSRHAVTGRTRILTDPVRHVFRDGLQDLAEYDWLVAAVDGYGAYSVSETRSFLVNNPACHIGYNPNANNELYPPASLQGENLTLPMVVVPCGGNERYEVHLRETAPNSGVFAVADYSIVWGFDAEEACFDSQSLLLHIPRLE
ncbi:MAG: caspase family protein, partial [Gammaproteobacteria bacterium]|nr:caspase family protein [Gammaproteobacteria bacterium]